MIPSLIDSLRGRAAPLLIDIDERGCIVAAEYDLSSPYYVGVFSAILKETSSSVWTNLLVPKL